MGAESLSQEDKKLVRAANLAGYRAQTDDLRFLADFRDHVRLIVADEARGIFDAFVDEQTLADFEAGRTVRESADAILARQMAAPAPVDAATPDEDTAPLDEDAAPLNEHLADDEPQNDNKALSQHLADYRQEVREIVRTEAPDLWNPKSGRLAEYSRKALDAGVSARECADNFIAARRIPKVEDAA